MYKRTKLWASISAVTFATAAGLTGCNTEVEQTSPVASHMTETAAPILSSDGEGEGAVVASSRSPWNSVREQVEKWVGDIEGPMVCGGSGLVGNNIFEYGGGQSVVMGNEMSNGSETLLYGMCGSVFEIVNEKWIEKVIIFASNPAE